MDPTQKPKLVFIRWIHPDRAKYIHSHLDQHIKCLSQFFDVTVIGGDCDYGQVCDVYQPDLALFESGVYASDLPRRVSNTFAHPQVPKLGFCNADAMCGSRSTFIADMAKWGIETFFAISVSLAEYTPEIAENLFVWPNAVDSELYHDYGERKHIPVLFTGSQAPHYPWRNRVSRRVIQYYPSMTCPHFGWGSQASTSRMLFGEQYARLLNASWFVPTCGTVVHDAVRKHFEIPACKACLITEATPALAAAGFVDWENCVYADEHDVIDKIDYLIAHGDELERIVTAGYELVHSSHTLRHRDQLFQWFMLHRSLKPDQRIIQGGPFEALRIVDNRVGVQSSHLISNGVDRVLIREGDRQLWEGRYDDAETHYLKALAYLPYLPEAKLRMALCSLLKGHPGSACNWIEELLGTSQGLCAVEPDPVEWAYYIVALLCLGRVKKAGELAGEYPFLHHLELDRVRQLVSALRNTPSFSLAGSSRHRGSVHQLPARPLNEWVRTIGTMLGACKQNQLAERCLGPHAFRIFVSARSDINQTSRPCEEGEPSTEESANGRSATVGVRLAERFVSKRRTKLIRALVKKCLRRIERSSKYFMPYRFSGIRDDELFALIEQIAREANRGTMLIYGAVGRNGSTESCLLGARQNINRPRIVCVATPGPKLRNLQRRDRQRTQITCYDLPVRTIKEKIGIDFFELVIITGQSANPAKYEDVCGSGVIVIADISCPYNFSVYRELLNDMKYRLSAHNGAHRGGYAVFRRATILPEKGISFDQHASASYVQLSAGMEGYLSCLTRWSRL